MLFTDRCFRLHEFDAIDIIDVNHGATQCAGNHDGEDAIFEANDEAVKNRAVFQVDGIRRR